MNYDILIGILYRSVNDGPITPKFILTSPSKISLKGSKIFGILATLPQTKHLTNAGRNKKGPDLPLRGPIQNDWITAGP